MKTIACPQDSGLQRLAWMPAKQVVALAGALALVSCGATAGAQELRLAAPVIVPLDVTMEDSGWLETVPALVRSQQAHVAEPDAAIAAAMLEKAIDVLASRATGEAPMPSTLLPGESSEAPSVLADNEASPLSQLALLTVPPGFSINLPAVAVPSGSNALVASVNTGIQSPPVRSTGIARDQRNDQKRTYKVNGSAIEFDIPLQLNGGLVGKVPLKIGADRNVSVHLPELLALLQDRMDPQMHRWLGSAYNVNSHISFEQLRSAGVDVRYDAANDIVVMATN